MPLTEGFNPPPFDPFDGERLGSQKTKRKVDLTPLTGWKEGDAFIYGGKKGYIKRLEPTCLEIEYFDDGFPISYDSISIMRKFIHTDGNTTYRQTDNNKIEALTETDDSFKHKNIDELQDDDIENAIDDLFKNM